MNAAAQKYTEAIEQNSQGHQLLEQMRSNSKQMMVGRMTWLLSENYRKQTGQSLLPQIKAWGTGCSKLQRFTDQFEPLRPAAFQGEACDGLTHGHCCEQRE